MACALTALMLSIPGGAQARVLLIHGHAYGVTYARPGAANIHANAAPLTRPSALGALAPPNTGPTQAPLTYGGGPVMHTSKVYLIFWAPAGTSFGAKYENPTIQWMKDLAGAASVDTSEYSILRQYKDKSGAGISGVTFGGAFDDSDPYPALSGGCAADNLGTPCVNDGAIQNEVLAVANAENLPIDTAGAPKTQYVVFTPLGVDGCMDNQGDCTFSQNNGYCGYHSDFQPTQNTDVIYDVLPDAQCDSGQAPSGTDFNQDTDGNLDTLIHELAESATDPINGSGWTDSSGYETGDKCDGQSVSSMNQYQEYGEPLGGSLGNNTAFNQLLGGHTYFTQELWSDASTRTPSSSSQAGCVQRLGPTPVFAAPSGVKTGVSTLLDGSGSYDLSGTLSTYTWHFGDGSPADTTDGSRPHHIYDKAGRYYVTLTVGDARGVADQTSEFLILNVAGATLVPSVSALVPSSGPAGSTVTISGTNLASAQAVKFGTVAARIVSDTPTQIKAIVPSGATTGKISVITMGGTSISPSVFTVS